MLIYKGFKYHRNKSKAHCIFWRCWRKDCGKFIQTNVINMDDVNANIVIQNEPDHGHEKDEEYIHTDQFRENLRVEISRNTTAPVKRVYNAVAANEHRGANVNSSIYVPAFASVKSIMSRERSRLIPPIPQSINDVVVNGEWAQTWRGQNFLLDQDDMGVLCFATEDDLRKLATCREIFVNGTF